MPFQPFVPLLHLIYKKVMRRSFPIKLFIAILVIFSASCKKDKKWKIPTDVKFKMDINRSAGVSGNLVWISGNIMIANFTFDGKRDQGEDVFFTKTYSSGLNVFFDPNNPVSTWNFDIPQGTYTQINVSYKTYGSPGDKQIVVEGTYTNTANSNVYPVKFEFEAEEFYNVVAKTSSGSTQIVLNKDVVSTATIKADPVYWFQTVTTNMMDNATFVSVSGNPTILINDATNDNIYDAVRDRMDDDVTTVTFN